ncbi:MAG: hypothetical protein JRC77_09245, partial [Deltaproteobacteria bacterium]|nr:hypothetical protein [Deltaproteobacteria bacterium]
LVSSLVLAVMGLIGFVNFHLVAPSMSHVLGANGWVGPFQVSAIAALVMVATQAVLGVVLMESLRVTHLFPVIGNLDTELRKRLLWISAGLVFALACVEASLAYMKQVDAAELLANQWAASALTVPESYWVPSFGQSLLGFILPLVMLFVAIPLEAFAQASRAFLGAIVSVCLLVAAFVFQAIASASRQLGEVFVHLYDLLVIFPLKLEELVVRMPASQDAASDVSSDVSLHVSKKKEGESRSGSQGISKEKAVHK